MSATEELAVDVATTYRHGAKLALSRPSIALGEAVLKWYDIAPPPDQPIEPDTMLLARRALAEAERFGELRLAGASGFVILHRCGEGFHFLLVSTWQNANELWETVWAKDGENDPAFHPWPLEGTHRPTFCVWELGVVAHERKAWTRFLRSSRDGEARLAYLRDTFEGEV